VAKKLRYRAEKATPRDLLDLAVVTQNNFELMKQNKSVFAEKIEIFINQCMSNESILKPVFQSIDTLENNLTFDECIKIVKTLNKAIK